MLDSIQSLLDAFPEGAALIREGEVVSANAMARRCRLAPGVPLPDSIPLPEPGRSGSGLFVWEGVRYTFSCSGSPEGQMLLFRPAPQAALTSRQLDGALRQLRELLGEILAEVGPAAGVPGREVPADAFSKSFHRLFRLTDNLDYLRQAAGAEPEFHPSTLDLAGLCRHVVQMSAPLLREAGVSLELQSRDASLLVPGDHVLLQRMLLNLISNAAREAAEGQVLLTLRRQGDQAHLAVSGSGPRPVGRQLTGLLQEGPGDDIPLPGQGAGLGLAIARHIITLHGGSMLVELGEAAPSVRVSLPAGAGEGRVSVRSPILQRGGALDPFLMELSDLLPAHLFGMEALD